MGNRPTRSGAKGPARRNRGKTPDPSRPGNGSEGHHKCVPSEQIYRGAYLDQAPDLIIGYNRGYRASSASVLGSFSETVLEENTNQWRGDHLIDAQHVPGILLSNRKIREQAPTLRDVAPTILSKFQISRPDVMTGNDLFR